MFRYRLKFAAGPSGLDFFISSDMFYLELVLEPTGGVKDVKVHHEGKVEQVREPSLLRETMNSPISLRSAVPKPFVTTVPNLRISDKIGVQLSGGTVFNSNCCGRTSNVALQ